MRRLRWIASIAVGVVLLGWPGAGPASAHVTFVGSDPADGARIDALPRQLTLTFTEALSEPAAVVLTTPDGARDGAGEARVDGRRVLVDLTAPGAAGTYAVAFRVVSVDGHPVSGRLTFVVGDGPLVDPSADVATPAADEDTSVAPEAPAAAPTAATGGGTGGPGVGTVQVGVGVGLFSLAGLLLLLSRRRPD